LSDTQTFFQNMRNFYMENSVNIFSPIFTVTSNGSGFAGAYILSGSLAFYGADCGSDVACNTQKLFDDAASAANAAGQPIDSFDHIMIYHAGFGQETTGAGNDIWSVYFPTPQNPPPAGGKSFPGFTVVPEKEAGGFSALGVICHEYGHQIGLPDLYDTSVSGGLSTVGAWDVMDFPYAGGSPLGSLPPHLGAWSKKFLGFALPQTTTGSVTLAPAEIDRTAFNQMNIALAPQEYFLMEYRRKAAATFDQGIPMESGLALWHVDDSIALDPMILSNNFVNAPALNGRGRRGVDLVEADGTEVNPLSNDLGNGNAFVDGQVAVSPQTNSFSGLPSGLAITNISGASTSLLRFSLSFISAAPHATITRVINYPSPGGNNEKYPVRPGAPLGTVTTFVIQLNRPVQSQDISLDIYDLAGTRVRSVSGTALALKIGAGEPTADYKWVYEYDWDGKNDGGDPVAPGVYLTRATADREIKTGKLILIR
jgi:M6 family metalloprotease-like protein